MKISENIKTIKLLVDVQENGIIRLNETGKLIARLTDDNDTNFEKLALNKLSSDDVPEEIKEEIMKEYAEDLYEEFIQIERFEGKITLKDIVDILQIGQHV